MTGSFDDVPEWLVISENCKPIHNLKPEMAGERAKDEFKIQELIDFRNSKGFSVEALAFRLKLGKKAIEDVESGFWGCKRLEQIFKLYSFYGGMVCLYLVENEMSVFKPNDCREYNFNKNQWEKKRKKFLRYIFEKYDILKREIGARKAARAILKILERKNINGTQNKTF